MQLSRLRPIALALAASLALAYALTELAPRRYVATGSVLLPGSRMVRSEHVSTDPTQAVRWVAGDLEAREGRVIDPPSVLPLPSRPIRNFALAAAGKRFRVVLVDTPAGASGPDLQIFAALAGGALVVARKGDSDQHGLAGLSSHLRKASARVVATVLSG